MVRGGVLGSRAVSQLYMGLSGRFLHQNVQNLKGFLGIQRALREHSYNPSYICSSEEVHFSLCWGFWDGTEARPEQKLGAFACFILFHMLKK